MIFLLIILLSIPCMATGPKYIGSKTDPQIYQEFINTYHDIPNKATTPTVYQGAGAPSFAPHVVGDIYVSTTTGKVYISTAAVTSASWAVVN